MDLDADVLVAAAYLHDLGYAPALALTGFHPLDGAEYLSAIGEPRLARLVANHSGAKHEAALRGCAPQLKAYPDEADLLTACLTYCDLTTGPQGQRVSLAERLCDIHRRYGKGHPVQRAIDLATPELCLTVSAIERRLSDRSSRSAD